MVGHMLVIAGTSMTTFVEHPGLEIPPLIGTRYQSIGLMMDSFLRNAHFLPPLGIPRILALAYLSAGRITHPNAPRRETGDKGGQPA